MLLIYFIDHCYHRIFRWNPSGQVSNTIGFATIYKVIPGRYGSNKRYKSPNYTGYPQNIYRITNEFLCIGGYRFGHNTSYGNSHKKFSDPHPDF